MGLYGIDDGNRMSHASSGRVAEAGRTTVTDG